MVVFYLHSICLCVYALCTPPLFSEFRSLTKPAQNGLATDFMALLFVIAVVNYDKWYTVINFSLAIPLTYLVYKYNIKLLSDIFY